MSSERYGSSDSKGAAKASRTLGCSEKADPVGDDRQVENEQAQDEIEHLRFDEPIEASEASVNAISDLLKTSSSKKDYGLEKSEIDEALIANLGSGNNDYGVLEELLPPIDFSAIPLTQPKRVQAKSDPNSTDVLPDNEGNPNKIPPKASKRKKKPASLLDSYFKGL